jgi:hypothetical protein
MDAKDFCNCEHAQTLLSFMVEALWELERNEHDAAYKTLALGLSVHEKAKDDYETHVNGRLSRQQMAANQQLNLPLSSPVR